MALIKRNDNFYWHTQDTYLKISWMLIKETWEDEVWKLYSLEAQIDYFTNETKAYHFSQVIEKIEWLRYEELSLENVYLKIKQLDKFKDYEDII